MVFRFCCTFLLTRNETSSKQKWRQSVFLKDISCFVPDFHSHIPIFCVICRSMQKLKTTSCTGADERQHKNIANLPLILCFVFVCLCFFLPLILLSTVSVLMFLSLPFYLYLSSSITSFSLSLSISPFLSFSLSNLFYH